MSLPMSQSSTAARLFRPVLLGEPSMRSGGTEKVLLPIGTVTLLLADVEGSVRQWEGDEKAAAEATALMDAVVDDAVGRNSGARPVEQGEGDSFIAAFARASDAVRCALDIQSSDIGGFRLRMALHTGEVQLRDEGNYIGSTINRCARLREIAHGGQVLISQATRDLVLDSLPERASLADLGTQRLRDLERPEHVYQLLHPDLAETFPPLRSLDRQPHNLPLQLTRFIGRDQERRQVGSLLAEHRLVTLIGTGGCGKTRLALQAAADVSSNFPDGVWFVDLAPISDEALVSQAIAAAASVPETPGRQILDRLAEKFADQRLLVVLDNCEHLVAACAAVVDRLLRSAPELSILATSREPLATEGEVTWRVPSLTLPDEIEPGGVATLCDYDAVALFVDRARRARPNFSLTEENAGAVTAVCRRLGGIPLGIELAAARVRFLTPEQIAAGLDDRFHLLTGGTRTALPRQQTLLASIDWSHALLSEEERMLFRRLGVFSGGFALDAAEVICGQHPLSRYDVLDLLARLVDRSLVLADENGAAVRYRMLETIRQYALDRLRDAGEDEATRDRHAHFFMEFIAGAEDRMLGSEYFEIIERAHVEQDNLRAGLGRIIALGDVDSALRAAIGTKMWCQLFGLATEAVGRLEEALSREVGDDSLRARALSALAQARSMMGDWAGGEQAGREALELARAAGDPASGAYVTAYRASAVAWRAPDEARGLLEEYRAAGSRNWEPSAISAATQAEMALLVNSPSGDLEEARRWAEELKQQANTSGGFGYALQSIIQIALFRGDLETARRTIEEGLGWISKIPATIPYWATHMGAPLLRSTLATMEGRYEEAIELADQTADHARRVGSGRYQWQATILSGRAALASGDLQAAALKLEPFASTRSPISGLLPVLLVAPLAEVAALQGDTSRALALLEEAGQGGMLVTQRAIFLTRARVNRLAGKHEAAFEAAHEALGFALQAGAAPDAADALELVATLSTEEGNHELAARLLAAAKRSRDESGLVRFAVYQPDHDRTIAGLKDALGPERLEELSTEGAAMTWQEAAAYAQRGRGVRGRPTSGWGSLTPTELQVVELVSEGLSNPAIGERLFVSRHTVKTHLTNIFGRLGVSSRSELAAAAVARRAGVQS